MLLSPAFAAAQTDPKFDYAKVEPVKPETAQVVEWKAQAKAGGLWTGGNSQVKSALIGVTASRKQGANKLSLEGTLAYGRSNVWQTLPSATTPGDVDIERNEVTTTNNFLAKGRYDRFFTQNNAGYVSAQAAGDRIAGKTFFGGGQIGYSRQLLKNDMNLVVAEIGYDFSYETYLQPPAGKAPLEAVAVHSARLFAGETLKLSSATGIVASVEALLNLNRESKALNHVDGSTGVDAFKDTRLLGKAALTTTVYKALSLAVGFTVKYDQNPAPLPLGPILMGATLAPDQYASTKNQPFAETTDYQTEATLIYTFL
ncbi:MAG TPA: DUF481 domain-containing protein [Polyangia bacterium]|nr:DUF481 domain-containing protein [Polyangia bacterium]